MQEGMITAWIAAEGALVREGDPLYTLEIEKSALDIQSPANGRLKILAAAGTIFKVGEVIGEIED